MNHLPHLIQSFIHLSLRPFEALLRQVHCIRQKGASLLNLLHVAAVLHLDSPAFEELTQVFVNFVLFNLFHKMINLLATHSQNGTVQAITQLSYDCSRVAPVAAIFELTNVHHGTLDWRTRQDLNLQPFDPKSNALSN